MPITTLFVDLDDTLYPPSSGLWPAIRERIAGFMIERLGIPPAEADELRRIYFERYGTTLRGLEINYDFDRQDFLAYVHDVDLRAYLSPDPALRSALLDAPCRKFVLTNSDIHHSKRVMTVLGVTDCFAGIIDTNVLHPYCKPDPAAFERALLFAGEPDPRKCALIDDLPRTVRAAREFGMKGILYGIPDPTRDTDAVLVDWSTLGQVLRGIDGARPGPA